ncbi:hypothetical protein [Flavisolibacter tropicus]|uniref:Uncharacterized protein n=1 Tax=Flavisolibacter tropicus TaxID=1492898 RepID=A0A172U1C1_9BACT|nr:hypothetical protein [Flavisolibacter tropicus]ANE53145.1 hypothetical protein SY85_24400 [Flavisolibacter tropicus]
MHYTNSESKPPRNKPQFNFDYDIEDLFDTKPVRIVLGAAILVGGLYLAGKVLRLLGGTVEDVRYFSSTLKS